MGVEIVKASMFYGRHLSGNAYKVLIAMSMQALDKPQQGRPASLYFGGWDSLAINLGYEDAARNTSGHVVIKRAVRELRDAGHITPMNEAGRGTRQSYSLHPGGLPKGEQSVPAMGEQNVPPKGEQKVPHRGNKTFPPRKEQESVGLTQDTNLTVGAQVQTASPKAEPHRFRGRIGDDCSVCGRAAGDRRVHPIRLIHSESA